MYTRIKASGITIAERRIIRTAAKFFASKLMTERLHRTLTVYIELADGLLDTEDLRGDCEWLDDGYRGKEFSIRVATGNGTDMHQILETLAHEMVHVKQFARGEMRDLRSVVDSINWNGSRIDTSKIDYWDLPWEIEAHGREQGLFTRLCVEYPDVAKFCGIEIT